MNAALPTLLRAPAGQSTVISANAGIQRRAEPADCRSRPQRLPLGRALQLLVIAYALGTPWSAAAAPPAPPPAPARYTLKQATVEPAPQRTGRYALRGRFARAESAGELREGEHFVLIGRFAKAGVGCGVDRIFQNGFEGP